MLCLAGRAIQFNVCDFGAKGDGETSPRITGATNILSATVTPGWWCDQMMRLPPGKKTEWQLGKEITFRGELRAGVAVLGGGGNSSRSGAGRLAAFPVAAVSRSQAWVVFGLLPQRFWDDQERLAV